MLEIDFYTFNILEGIFWIALSFVVVFYFLHQIPERYRFLGSFTGATLFVFGLSDFAESYFGSFMYYPNEWLFIMKSVFVLAQITAIFWYLHLRIKDNNVIPSDMKPQAGD